MKTVFFGNFSSNHARKIPEKVREVTLGVLHSAEKRKAVLQEARLSGRGLFTGKEVSICLRSAPRGSGVVFQRVDLPGKPEIPAQLAYVKQTPRCTCLASGDAQVGMVEHLMSALFACKIYDARIEVEGPEIPSVDGSALPFVELIERSGLQEKSRPTRRWRVEQPVFFSEGETHLVALPDSHFRLSYTLHYPNSVLLRSQYYTFNCDTQCFKTEIAPCRTFSLYEEILPFIEKGILNGGGLENALVIQKDRVLNPEGCRFPDEMVRHKLLDLMGDLALLGAPVQALIIAIRSGHASNVAFAKKIAKVACLEAI